MSRYCPLVMQGFSNFLGLFQGIMANPYKLSLTILITGIGAHFAGGVSSTTIENVTVGKLTTIKSLDSPNVWNII